MAKILIKENEIRQYVRHLIREAIQSERVEDPEDVAEREKMLSGQRYDRSKFPLGGKSLRMERDYRASRNLPVLKKPKGGIIPTIIGPDGEDLTPENRPEAIQANLDKRKIINAERNAKRYVKKGDREELAQNRGLSSDDAINLTHDDFANDAENDPHTLKWLNMTPEERAAEAERIRNARKMQGVESNAKLINDLKQSREGERGGHKTKEQLLQRIEDLEGRKAELEQHPDFYKDELKSINSVIKDNQNILKKYYGEKNYLLSDDEIDSLLNDEDSEAMMNDLRGEWGDALVDPSSVAKNVKKERKTDKEKEFEDPMNDLRNDKRINHFDDTEDFFDSDDSWAD